MDPGPAGGQARPRTANVPSVKLTILSSDDDIQYSYKTIKLIAEGRLGKTFEVEDVKNPPTRMAMKVQKKRQDSAEGPFSDQILRFYKEMLILNKILPKHKNIAEFKELLVSKTTVYICTELCSTTASMDDLYQWADNTSGRRIFQQLSEAVRFIHQHGIVHLNLRPDNILFSDGDFTECKIVDFGHAGYNPNLATLVHNEFRASSWFLPEELESDIVRRGSAVDDVRSLGIILHGILCGRYVASAVSPAQEAAIYGHHPPRKEKFDEAAYDLLKKIGPLPYGPGDDNKFPNMDTVCHHPWIRTGDVTLSLLNDVNEQMSANWGDLTEMADLMISGGVPLRIVEDDSEVESLYRKLGNIQAGGQNTRLFEVIDEQNSNRLAMKVSVRRGTPKSVKDAAKYPARDAFSIQTEVLIMWRVLPRHECIVELRAVLVSRDFAYFLTPLCERYTLADFITFARNDTAKKVFKQLAETVRFMHHYGVVHMDLRLENILFRNPDMDLGQIEITNFSRSAYVAELARATHNGFKSSKWFGPEYMQIASKYGKVTADIRALGRILHAMICGNADPGLEFTELVQHQGKTFDDRAFNLLFKIGPRPIGPAEDRNLFSVEQICNHEWLTK